MDDLWGCILPILGLLYLVGMCLAVVVSWEVGHSVPWSSLDGILSWAYIICHFLIAS
jgi:hypothetical protein